MSPNKNYDLAIYLLCSLDASDSVNEIKQEKGIQKEIYPPQKKYIRKRRSRNKSIIKFI